MHHHQSPSCHGSGNGSGNCAATYPHPHPLAITDEMAVFILTRLPPPFVRMRMLMTKNVPITIVDKNGCTRPQRASLRRSLRTRTLKPSSPPSPSPPPFVENENEDGLPPPFLRVENQNERMNIASSSPSPSPTKIAPSAVLES